jgi:hypothetical protein
VKKKKADSDKDRNEDHNGGPLDILGDEVKQNEFKLEIVKRFTSLSMDNPEARNSYEVRLSLMEQAVRESEQAEKFDPVLISEIAEEILTECALMIKWRDGLVNVDEIDHEFLKQVDTTDFVYNFVTDLMGPVDMKTWREKLIYVLGIKSLGFRTKEEHREYWISRGIKSVKKWMNDFSDEIASLGYKKCCYDSFGMSNTQWIEYIWGEVFNKSTYTNNNTNKKLEDYKQIWLDNKIGGEKEWFQFYTQNKLNEKGFAKYFWRTIGFDQKGWMPFLFNYKIKTKKEHKEFWIKNNIKGRTNWHSLFRNKEFSKMGFSFNPWKKFEISCKEWTNYVWGNDSGRSDLILENSMIKMWIKRFYLIYNYFPRGREQGCTVIPAEYKIRKWSSLDKRLSVGGRGLPGGSSLSKLVDEVESEMRQAGELPEGYVGKGEKKEKTARKTDSSLDKKEEKTQTDFSQLIESVYETLGSINNS